MSQLPWPWFVLISVLAVNDAHGHWFRLQLFLSAPWFVDDVSMLIGKLSNICWLDPIIILAYNWIWDMCVISAPHPPPLPLLQTTQRWIDTKLILYFYVWFRHGYYMSKRCLTTCFWRTASFWDTILRIGGKTYRKAMFLVVKWFQNGSLRCFGCFWCPWFQDVPSNLFS